MPKAARKDVEAARSLVRARDGHRCQMCGQSIVNIPSSIHHRIPRGSGGSALLERASNLVRLCGDGVRGCHGFIESNRRNAEETGWLLPKCNASIDPAKEPLFTFAGWRLLDDLGGSLPYVGAA